MTDILDICRSQQGYREQGSGWTKYGAWLDAQTPATHVYADADWCGAFQLWCIARVPGGLDAAGGLDKAFAEVQVWLDWMSAHGRLSHTPAPRRLVWYDWAGTPRGANHIGLVERFNASTIWAWEGNHNNAVELVQRPRDSQIMGYGEWWSHIAKPPAPPAPVAAGNAWFMAGA